MRNSNIIILAALGGGFYFLNKFLQKSQGTPELDVTGGAGMTETEALNLAQQLLYSMHQFGTDVDTIYSVVTPLTAQQLIMVYNQFGRPPYWGFGYDQWLGTPMDLFGWFQQELNASDIAKLKGIFAKTGILWP